MMNSGGTAVDRRSGVSTSAQCHALGYAGSAMDTDRSVRDSGTDTAAGNVDGDTGSIDGDVPVSSIIGTPD